MIHVFYMPSINVNRVFGSMAPRQNSRALYCLAHRLGAGTATNCHFSGFSDERVLFYFVVCLSVSTRIALDLAKLRFHRDFDLDHAQ